MGCCVGKAEFSTKGVSRKEKKKKKKKNILPSLLGGRGRVIKEKEYMNK